ncbi:hypothetical protein EMPG_12945 [Blastomyces silverae]|uniref:Uncharacterized protein n=1 Tax=Blastomyces silverae TaxID=2060906 RepID=A0A0H1BLK0_9EURO|nr:hypothetical protein EMPG_12945 [Blastomyces silverae]
MVGLGLAVSYMSTDTLRSMPQMLLRNLLSPQGSPLPLQLQLPLSPQQQQNYQQPHNGSRLQP